MFRTWAILKSVSRRYTANCADAFYLADKVYAFANLLRETS